MLNTSLEINGVFYPAGTALSALPAEHIERLKTRGLIDQPKKQTKPKPMDDVETKGV